MILNFFYIAQSELRVNICCHAVLQPEYINQILAAYWEILSALCYHFYAYMLIDLRCNMIKTWTELLHIRLGYLTYLELTYALMLNLSFQQPKLNTEIDKPLLPPSGFTKALQFTVQKTSECKTCCSLPPTFKARAKGISIIHCSIVIVFS